MEKNQYARAMFQTFRVLAKQEWEVYSRLRTTFPTAEFPKHAKRVEKYGMMAEMWGKIATILGDGTVDYLEDWRVGKWH